MDNHAQTTPSQQFAIQKLYVKHIMFDIPIAPELFKKKEQPKINFQLEIKNMQLPETNHYEVTLGLKADGMIEEEKIFELNMQQSGIFVLEGYTPEQLEQLLNNHCASILFPYAREVISETAVRGGLMPIILSPINFDALYAQKKEQEKKQDNNANSYSDMVVEGVHTLQ
jgi:preprotein translocase subunit SecB